MCLQPQLQLQKLPAESEAVSEALASNSLTYYQENHLFYDNIGWNGHMHSFVSAIQIVCSYCVFILKDLSTKFSFLYTFFCEQSQISQVHNPFFFFFWLIKISIILTTVELLEVNNNSNSLRVRLLEIYIIKTASESGC